MIASAWSLLADSAPWLLAGLLAAALLEAWLPRSLLLRWLRGEGAGSVARATLLGVPLPLCSCSVLPTALALRRNGAGRGPTLAFLVATPETSVTSVALTWGLLGPAFAVVRPVAAALSALAAGLAGGAWGRDRQDTAHAAGDHGCCDAGSSCASDEGATAEDPSAPAAGRLRRGLAFAFGDLLDDVFVWILLGVAAAAAVLTLVPPNWFTDVPGGALGAMLAMVLVGVPLYVCAEASTPLAAALVAQGLSPGAALVLLLVGPATNVGSLGVLAREFGLRTVWIYLGAVIAVAVLAGLVVDAGLGLAPTLGDAVLAAEEHGPSAWGHAAAAAFVLLGLAASLRRRRRRAQARALVPSG